MSWSFGEIEALARKAAHGTGKPWGVAEEAGWAVRWLAEAGMPGPAALAALMQGPVQLCPVATGCAISDGGALTVPASIGPVGQPVLVLPFVAAALGDRGSVLVRVGEVEAQVAPDGIRAEGTLPSSGCIELLSFAPPLPPMRRMRRVEAIAPEALALLERFAALTYAPATEQSRALGAGAGLTDND